MPNQSTKQLQADKLQSTFWWRINFKPGIRKNRAGQSILFMDGYSKFNGHPEAINPWACFCNKVEMLFQNGYFQDAETIDFHKRAGMMCNKITDPLFVTLLPERYEIPPENFKTFPIEVRYFLNNFYKAITKGDLPDKHLKPASIMAHDEMLNKTGFKGWEEVYDYGEKLKAHEFPPGAIAGFIRREMERLANKGKI